MIVGGGGGGAGNLTLSGAPPGPRRVVPQPMGVTLPRAGLLIQHAQQTGPMRVTPEVVLSPSAGAVTQGTVSEGVAGWSGGVATLTAQPGVGGVEGSAGLPERDTEGGNGLKRQPEAASTGGDPSNVGTPPSAKKARRIVPIAMGLPRVSLFPPGVLSPTPAENSGTVVPPSRRMTPMKCVMPSRLPGSASSPCNSAQQSFGGMPSLSGMQSGATAGVATEEGPAESRAEVESGGLGGLSAAVVPVEASVEQVKPAGLSIAAMAAAAGMGASKGGSKGIGES